jgi:hypothetical protein
MPANSVLQNKIDQLYDWLVDNASRIDPDDKDQAFDALVTLQKESLGALLANAPLPDINAAVRAIDDAIDGINNETKKLAANISGSRMDRRRSLPNRKSPPVASHFDRRSFRFSLGSPAPEQSTLSYCGAGVTGNDGATLAAGCIAAEAAAEGAVDADGPAAGVATAADGRIGAATIASLRAAGEGLASGDACTAEASLPAGGDSADAGVG